LNLIRSITRYVSRYGFTYGPSAQAVEVRLVQCQAASNVGGGYTDCVLLITPWACLNCHADATDEQMAAALGTSFATEAKALAHAERECPWYSWNTPIRERLLDARRWRGFLVGDGQLADAIGVTTEQLRRLSLGQCKATRKQLLAADNYHGGTV